MKLADKIILGACVVGVILAFMSPMTATVLGITVTVFAFLAGIGFSIVKAASKESKLPVATAFKAMGTGFTITLLAVVVGVEASPKQAQSHTDTIPSPVADAVNTPKTVGAAEKLKDGHREITKTEEWPQASGGTNLHIWMTAQARGEDTLMRQALMPMATICKSIAQDWPGIYQTVMFFVQTETIDQYGNPGVSIVMKLAFNVEDLGHINWERLPFGGLLNFAEPQLFPLARRAATSFCKQEYYSSVAANFCKDLVRR